MLAITLILAAPAILATSASAATCTKKPYEWWTEDVRAGDRAFYVDNHKDGASFRCAAKGASKADEVLDPVVVNSVDLGSFQQNSGMPCQLFRDLFGKHNVEPKKDTHLNKTLLGHNVSSNKTLLGRKLKGSCGTLGAPTTCAYPRLDLGQNSWGGVSFKISRVNDKHTTEGPTREVAYEAPFNTLSRNVTHAPVFGGNETACSLSTESSLYTSGVVLSGNPLPDDMKYKVYAFASEEERQLALADSRNEGLQYARQMKGENGCDVEIVYEFFPKPGGGLMVEISQTMNAVTEAMQRSITDSTSVYVIPAENIAVVQVSRKSIRENQYLPLRESCDVGMVTTIKFSTQFICKATGQRINITAIKMSRTSSTGKTVEEISTDPANPTTFQVDPLNPTDCYYKMECGGHQHEPDVELHMDATAAPESCGSFYWDPLIHAVPGDGQSASAMSGSSKSQSGTTSGATAILSASTSAILALAVNVMIMKV